MEWLNLVDTSYRQEFKDLFEASFGRVEARLQAMEARFEAKLAGVKSELRTDFVERLAKTQSSLILWMFGFWTANVLATGGLVLGAVALLKH